MSTSTETDVLLQAAARPTVEMIERLAADNSAMVRSILISIARSFADPEFKVTSLKKALKVNDRHLALFNAHVGLSVWNLIQECRMETGFRLLRDTLLSVDDIAIMLGYDTKRPFEKLCHRWCGLSPGKLRHGIRQAPVEILALGDEVFSWRFGVRLERGEVSDEEVETVRACLGHVSVEL